MTDKDRVYVMGGVRTPFATWAGGTTGAGQKGGILKPFDPFDLGAAAIRGALEKTGIAAESLERVVFGNMYHVGPHACYGARYAAHRARVPVQVPCLTVSMSCGTGLYAVSAAAEEAARGARLVAVAGADTSSLVRRDVFVPSFRDISCGQFIARTAELMAQGYGFGREAQDAWARRSHERAARARELLLLKGEIIPLGGLSEDDGILENPSEESFAKAEPLFEEGGMVTKANTHGIADGGSALILADEAGVKACPRPPLGRILSSGFAGLEPDRMAFASVPAVENALAAAGLTAGQVDLWELNETFAAQMLIDIKELGLDPEKVNVNGGAIALGHAFGATGPRLVLSLLLELRRRGGRHGAASISIGGGQGIAVVVESL